MTGTAVTPSLPEQTPGSWTAAEVKRAAGTLADPFRSAIQGLSYENKGILHSEMLFLLACSRVRPFGRILESGRARAQSTRVLAALFPDRPIVSVEFDPNSPDVAVAAARLKGLSHVELLFGDSMTLLPQKLQDGDLVIIDGPKHFRSLRLALKLLATGKPSFVFVHDLHRPTPERDYLERYLPDTLFSDEPAFVERFRSLDEECWALRDASGSEGWKPHWFEGREMVSYGPTLACIPGRRERPWAFLGLALMLSQTWAKVKRKLR